MKNTARLLSLLALHIAVLGCDDVAAPPQSVPRDLDVFIPALAVESAPLRVADSPAVGGETGEDADAPPEFDQAAAILDARITAGFTKTRAYAQAMMRFFANRGMQTATLYLTYNGTPMGPRTATGRRREPLPGVYRIDTTASTAIGDECGHLADAVGYHEAYHEWGAHIWSEETRDTGDDEAQPICEKEQQVVQGGNDPDAQDDTGWYICYYTHYFDAEGNYLYTKFNGCEPL